MSAQEVQTPQALALALSTAYSLPHQEHVDAAPSHYPGPGHDYMTAFATYELPVPTPRDRASSDISVGQPSHQTSSSRQDLHSVSDDLPIRVPEFPTCPHKETLNSEAQVEEWIAARAMEFAFTKHGERKARKASDGDSVQQAESQGMRQAQIPMDPSLRQIQDSIQENMLHQTLQSAIASGAPPSPTSHEMESLAAAAAAATHSTTIPEMRSQGALGSVPLAGYTHIALDGQVPVAQSESETRRPAATASTIIPGRARGGPQYESIVEYRCCWSGTYRPRNYENKSGQRRQRAPSTKVGCKARFVIRKVNQTGEYSVTYYWQHNGHDPTDIEQVKRMRSNQLPAAIKEHLRKKQEEDSRRNREQRGAARSGKSQVGSSDAQDIRGTKRSRDQDDFQTLDEQGRWLHPSYRSESGHPGTAHSGFSLNESGSLYEAIGRGNGDQSRSSITALDPRLGTAETATADRAFDEFTLNRGASPTDYTVPHAHEPLAVSGGVQLPPHAVAQQHHQQMLALIPAPQPAGTNDVGSPLQQMVQHQAILGSPLTGVSIGPRYHQSQQQLSDLRTPTAQPSFPGVEGRRESESFRLLAAEGPVQLPTPPQTDAPASLDLSQIPIGVWEQQSGSAPLGQLFDECRQSVNMSVIQTHETLNALDRNRFSGELSREGPTEGLNTTAIREDMLGIMRLGQELAQRVLALARTVGDERARDNRSGSVDGIPKVV